MDGTIPQAGDPGPYRWRKGTEQQYCLLLLVCGDNETRCFQVPAAFDELYLELCSCPPPLKSLLSRFLITAMENEMKTNASIPPPLLSGSSWALCGSFSFPSVPFLSPSLVILQLNHRCSDSHLLLSVICIFQTQNFGFLTLSLPETNKIHKLCFHLISKENPRSEKPFAHSAKKLCSLFHGISYSDCR